MTEADPPLTFPGLADEASGGGAPGSGLRIESISTVVVGARLRNWIFVKVTTSEPGLVGWGEATMEWKTRAVCAAVEDLSALVVGQDPLRIEHLWQSMYRHPYFKGGPVEMSAISGIDQALWDVKGKHLRVPVWQLLGGATRDTIRLYDHLGGGDSEVVYGEPSPERFAEAAQRSVEDGFTALKALVVPVGDPLPATRQLSESHALMAALRETVGEGVEIMVDLHGRTTPAGALLYGRALAELRPWFFEEPCQPEDIGGMAEVARGLPFPVATGERLVTLAGFRDVLQARAAAVLQPDVCHVGGITALRRVAALASAFQVSMAPHNPLGPVATFANLHAAASTPNFLIQEVMRADVPWRDEVVTTPLEIVAGRVALPSGPGLGVEVDEAAAARHPYVAEPPLATRLADGAVADW